MRLILFTSFICCLCLRAASYRPFFISTRTAKTPTTDAGKPLLLTPMIKDGKISKARELSRVSPLLPNIHSYAGFLTVNESMGSHLYFWFFPTTSGNWSKTPLILWLQGGPGCSSMYALFTENGPFFVIGDKLKQRKYAWTNRYNVLFIDQPVGSGFSFTEKKKGYITNQVQVGEHLHETLKQFYQLFPELKKVPFYISGESYAGKYIPAIGYKIHQENQRKNSAHIINLKGMLIGNGYSDPPNMLDYAEYLHRLQLVDFHQHERLERIQEETRWLIRSKRWIEANEKIDDLFNKLLNWTHLNSGNLYNYMELTPDNDDFVDFLERTDTRHKIHVGNTIFELCSEKVYKYFEVDFLQSISPIIQELLEHYPMMFFSGQLDIIVAYPLSENFLRKLHWSGADKYLRADRKIWKVGNRVAGYIKSAGNLIDVLVRNAGHMAPAHQPRNVLQLITKFIDGKLN